MPHMKFVYGVLYVLETLEYEMCCIDVIANISMKDFVL